MDTGPFRVFRVFRQKCLACARVHAKFPSRARITLTRAYLYTVHPEHPEQVNGDAILQRSGYQEQHLTPGTATRTGPMTKNNLSRFGRIALPAAQAAWDRSEGEDADLLSIPPYSGRYRYARDFRPRLRIVVIAPRLLRSRGGGEP